MNTLYSNEVQEAINIGLTHHYRFKVIDRRGTIDKPLPKEGWWYYPATVIPRNAQQRINMLEKADIKIQQVIIGHEASRLLKAPPKPAPIQIPTQPIQKPVIKKPKKDPADLAVVIHILKTMVKFAVGVAAAVAFLPVAILGTVIGTALLLDPTVIVVLEDGTWLECMSWYE